MSVQLLLSPEGQDLLGSLPPYDAERAERASRELRKAGWDPALVSAALTQQRLREKARLKLGDAADSMLFTEAGAQQATRAVVAGLHAARYVHAGCTNILDMTSGIGADAMAFARAGLDVTAVDLDPVTSSLAEWNLARFPGARAVNADALTLDLGPFNGAFADPARRSGRGRTFDPAEYSPPLDRVLDVRRAIPALGVKVGPGIPYSALRADTHAQWVSVDGDVVEAGLWFGPLAAVSGFDGPGRSALVIRTTAEGFEATEVEASPDPRIPAQVVPTRPLGRYIYEPDGAVIRSGALHALAAILDAGTVSEGIAYLTGNELQLTALTTAFEVVDVVGFKQVRSYCRERQVGSLEILKRGADVVPDQFRRGLKLSGPHAATVILTRLEGKHKAVFVRRI